MGEVFQFPTAVTSPVTQPEKPTRSAPESVSIAEAALSLRMTREELEAWLIDNFWICEWCDGGPLIGYSHRLYRRWLVGGGWVVRPGAAQEEINSRLRELGLVLPSRLDFTRSGVPREVRITQKGLDELRSSFELDQAP